MDIIITYKDGQESIIGLNNFTQAESLPIEQQKTIITKYNINYDSFLYENQPLSLAIYYYTKLPNATKSVQKPKFLDPLLFYNGDKKIEQELTPQMVVEQKKDLVLAELNPGTLTILVPQEFKNNVLLITVDGAIKIYYSYEWKQLLNLTKFNICQMLRYPNQDKTKCIEDQIKELLAHLIRLDYVENDSIVKLLGLPTELGTQLYEQALELYNQEQAELLSREQEELDAQD